jgi:hypothetical protein
MRDDAASNTPLCPSAQPTMAGSVVFGVLDTRTQSPRVGYLVEPRPVTDEVLAIAGPVAPAEIFRFGAPCAGRACCHFDGSDCRLATRIVQLLPVVVDVLPPCQLRRDCRWWQQEGKAACLRCPQIITETFDPPDLIRRAADPSTPTDRIIDHSRDVNRQKNDQ